MARNLKITWVKSGISCKKEHRRTIKAIGLRRLNHTVVKQDTPQLRGMIHSVQYLVKVEDAS